MSGREEILARIRAALADLPSPSSIARDHGTALADRPAPEPVPRDYRPAGAAEPDLDLFAERVADYRATVYRVAAGAAAPVTAADADLRVADRIAGVLRDRGITRVVVPDGFPQEWLPDVDLAREPLTTADLDAVAGTLTTCAVAIADTGTIVLDGGPGQGRRALSLVPDYLLIVVRADQVRAGVPDAIAALDPARPLTWISGPSATSDIELNRVEGVHGPRTLDVVLVA